MKRNVKKAKKQLAKIRELVKNTPSAFRGLSLEEAIRKMRRVREELWEEKFALRH